MLWAKVSTLLPVKRGQTMCQGLNPPLNFLLGADGLEATEAAIKSFQKMTKQLS